MVFLALLILHDKIETPSSYTSLHSPLLCQPLPNLSSSYTPHTALSALALALYALLLVLHAYRLYATRLYTFSALLITTNIFELIGYAFRLQSSPPPVGDPYSVINFVVSYFFIVVAPVFLSAAIYTTLTTFIAMIGEASAPLELSRRTILATFITADVVSKLPRSLLSSRPTKSPFHSGMHNHPSRRRCAHRRRRIPPQKP